MDTHDEEPTGALVRPYAVTGGRTRPRVEIAIEALVETTPRGRDQAGRIFTGPRAAVHCDPV